jgi:hypothetical protein
MLWVVTPFGVVVGYQRFRGPCCLHLHSTSLHSEDEGKSNLHHRENLESNMETVQNIFV